MRARERETGSNVRTLAQADVMPFRCPQAEARRLPPSGALRAINSQADVMAFICPQAEACGLTAVGGRRGLRPLDKCASGSRCNPERQATNGSDDFMRARERETGSNVRTLAQADVMTFRCPQAEACGLTAVGGRRGLCPLDKFPRGVSVARMEVG